MVALTYMAVAITTIVLVQMRARETAGLLAGLLLAGAVGLFAIGVGIAYPIACGIAMWRSWRLSTEEMRQQIRWPLMSIALALGIAVLLSLLSIGLSFVTGTAPPPWLFSVFEISTWVAYSVIPLAFAAAVLRYGLMDIRFIIRLTFFYLLTTASVYIGTFAVVLLLATAVGEAAHSNRVTTILITLLAIVPVRAAPPARAAPRRQALLPAHARPGRRAGEARPGIAHDGAPRRPRTPPRARAAGGHSARARPTCSGAVRISPSSSPPIHPIRPPARPSRRCRS